MTRLLFAALAALFLTTGVFAHHKVGHDNGPSIFIPIGPPVYTPQPDIVTPQPDLVTENPDIVTVLPSGPQKDVYQRPFGQKIDGLNRNQCWTSIRKVRKTVGTQGPNEVCVWNNGTMASEGGGGGTIRTPQDPTITPQPDLVTPQPPTCSQPGLSIPGGPSSRPC